MQDDKPPPNRVSKPRKLNIAGSSKTRKPRSAAEPAIRVDGLAFHISQSRTNHVSVHPGRAAHPSVPTPAGLPEPAVLQLCLDIFSNLFFSETLIPANMPSMPFIYARWIR